MAGATAPAILGGSAFGSSPGGAMAPASRGYLAGRYLNSGISMSACLVAPLNTNLPLVSVSWSIGTATSLLAMPRNPPTPWPTSDGTHARVSL